MGIAPIILKSSFEICLVFLLPSRFKSKVAADGLEPVGTMNDFYTLNETIAVEGVGLVDVEHEQWFKEMADQSGAIEKEMEGDAGGMPEEKFELWGGVGAQHCGKKRYKKSVSAYNKKTLLGERVKTVPADYGTYQPHERLNVDQIPFELDNQAKRGYVMYDETQMVQISGPQDGTKRFGTIQMCAHAGYPKKAVRLAMFFRGEGFVYESEKDSYHEGVDVYFSTKAWLTKDIASEWVTRTLKPWIVSEIFDNRKWLLFQDNLRLQKDVAVMGYGIESHILFY